MKVIDSTSPVRFTDGDALAPEDINRCFDYSADALADVSEKRYAICPILFPFVDSVTTGLTNASPGNLITWRFVCPVSCTVLRCFIDGNMTAAARVNFELVVAGSSARPTGATSPLLSIPSPAAVAVDVNDINVQKVQLVAGTVYDLYIDGTSFTTARADVVLHVAVDRWFLAGTVTEPSFVPDRFIDELADATTVAGNIAALNASAGALTARGMACFMVWARNFHSATSVNELTFTLPTYISTRANARIVRAYLSVGSSAAATTTALIRNAAAATVATVVVTGTSLSTTDSGALSTAINAGNPSLAAQDFSVRFSTTVVSPQVVQRAALLVWVEW